MSKIPVDIGNVKELKEQAKLFCQIAHHLFKASYLTNLTPDRVLSGVSKKLGYTSYGGMVACNKASRHYVPLYLTDITHFRYVASSISQETNCREDDLILVASFLQLGVRSAKQINFGTVLIEDGLSSSLLVGDAPRIDTKLIELSSANSMVVADVAITLKNMKIFLPELVSYLSKFMGTSEAGVVITPENILYEICSDFTLEHRILGYIEVTVPNPKSKKPRRVYTPIRYYEEDIEQGKLYDEIKSICEEFEFIPDTIFPKAQLMDSEEWLLKFQENLHSSNLDESVNIRLNADLTGHSLFTARVEIKEAEELVVEFLRRNETIFVYSHAWSDYEMREVVNKPYIEEWIAPEFSLKLIELNDLIHNQKQDIAKNLSWYETLISEELMQFSFSYRHPFFEQPID